MQLGQLCYLGVLAVAAVYSLILTIISMRRVTTSGSRIISVILAFISLYVFATFFEGLFDGVSAKILSTKVSYIGFYGAATFLQILAIQYSQRDHWLQGGGKVIVWILPVLMILIIWSNELHNLFWTGFSFEAGPLNILQYHHGILYYAGIVVIYGYVAVSLALMIHHAASASAIQRRQLRFFIAAALFPALGGMSYILGPDILHGVDIAPLCFLISAAIMLYAITRDQMLSLIPVARTRLIEDMSDGVLVMDVNGTIVDQNPASSTFLEIPDEAIGMTASDLFSAFPEVLEALHKTESSFVELLPDDSGTTAVEIRIKSLQNDSGKQSGFLFNLHDFSKRYETHIELEEANKILKQQLTEIEQLQVRLRDQAVRDPLTGLFNRRYLEETLPREIARSLRNNFPLTITMLDIDYFKELNDSYGHSAGDLFLQEAGNLFDSLIRQEDFVCRYGGEEFLIVFPGLSFESAIYRVDGLRKVFEEWVIEYDDMLLQRTISAGIAVCPRHGKTTEALIRAADFALYEVKESGRNRVQMAS